MASSKPGFSRSFLQNDEQIVNFMLETDSEGSDSDLSDLDEHLDAVDLSSNNDSYENMDENEEDNMNDENMSDENIPEPPKKQSKKTTKKKSSADKYENCSWVNNEPQEGMRRHVFDGEPGVSDDIESSEPIDIFEQIFTDEIVDMIVTNTNIYAQQYLSKANLKKTSRMKKWVDVTRNEIRLYLAVLIYRGLLYKPREHLYYTKNKLFETPGFRRMLPQNRFYMIEKFLHFVDNETLGDSYNKSAKIQPLLTLLVERFKSLYSLDRDVSVDESLLLWKGRLSWKQYIPKKRARFGLKSFVLAEGQSGYVWNIILYSGADTLLNDNINSHYHATKIVLSLMEDILYQGRCVYIDNWYTSIEICDVLNQKTTDVVGTLRRDRKGLPKALVNKKLKTGERIVQYEHKFGIAITHWKDKRDVFMLTTCIPDSESVVTRRGNEAVIPTVVHEYNNMMGGVDRSDQMTTSYPTERKRVKKWYKKHFMHLTNIATFNSHIIHQKKEGKLEAIEFRVLLVEQIVEKYGSNLTSSTERRGGRPSIEGNPFRLTERHFLNYIPESDKKKYPTKRCIVCAKKTIRKETRYQCKQCNEPLCVVPCFVKYHTVRHY